ncbi:hypothetical protein BC826DRAFT_1005130 [Russula brevipes]|nr:hypothetical protein BC826DRAFT_1005130 [Russula brevipes]
MTGLIREWGGVCVCGVLLFWFLVLQLLSLMGLILRVSEVWTRRLAEKQKGNLWGWGVPFWFFGALVLRGLAAKAQSHPIWGSARSLARSHGRVNHNRAVLS